MKKTLLQKEGTPKKRPTPAKKKNHLLEPDEIKALKNVQLIQYRSTVMMDKSITNSEHWAQMWTCNAEMARRFKHIVERREAKKHDNH